MAELFRLTNHVTVNVISTLNIDTTEYVAAIKFKYQDCLGLIRCDNEIALHIVCLNLVD